MTGSMTVYLELADALERQFASLGPGTRLPSEHELAARSGVSRFTARSALQELENRHMVRRTRGSGTFRSLRIPYPIRAGSPPSWSSLVAAAGHQPGYVVLAVESVRTPATVAARLGLSRGRRVVHLRRLGLIDGQVASHHDAWFPAALTPGLDGLDGLDGSVTHLLSSHYDLEVDRGWCQVELLPPPTGIAAQLELVGRPQCWHVESINHVIGSGARPGDAVEYARSWMRADCFGVFLELGSADV